MAFPAEDVITRARTLVQDEGAIRWTVPEMINWTNDALRVMISLHPRAFVKQETLNLVDGSEQSLTATQYRLLRLLGSVTLVGRDRLDAVAPGWEEGTPSATPIHYTYDEQDPRTFYIYPPVTAPVAVKAKLAIYPDPVANTTDVVDLDVIYIPVLADYLLHRAYGKHSKSEGNEERSLAALTRFAQALGVSAAQAENQGRGESGTRV